MKLVVLKAIGITSTEIVRSKPFILKKTIPPPARYDLAWFTLFNYNSRESNLVVPTRFLTALVSLGTVYFEVSVLIYQFNSLKQGF